MDGSYILMIVCCFITSNTDAQTLRVTPEEPAVGSPLVFSCDLPSTSAVPSSVSWYKQGISESTRSFIIEAGLSGVNCIATGAVPAYVTTFTCVFPNYTFTINDLTSEDTFWCSIPVGGVATYSNGKKITLTNTFGNKCSTTSPIITCSTVNSHCIDSNCKCTGSYEANADKTTCECPDCCCCKDKDKRDGACGTVLAVCICVIAVLCFLGYKGYHLGASLLLICAVILCLCAICGFILNSICLSKECCSYNDECCEAKNCFKADTIAGFVMAGLSVLGLPVGFFIFNNVGQNGFG